MSFEETPNYDNICKLLNDAANKLRFKLDDNLDWVKKKVVESDATSRRHKRNNMINIPKHPSNLKSLPIPNGTNAK